MRKNIFLVITLFSANLFAEVSVGMSEEDLLKEKGKPEGKTAFGSKAIYRWSDMEVRVEDGKVGRITVRDTEKEKESEERRIKIAEDTVLIHGQVERRLHLTSEYDAALMVLPHLSTPDNVVRAHYLRHNEKPLVAVRDELSVNRDGTLIAFQVDGSRGGVGIVNTRLHIIKMLPIEYGGLVRYYDWRARKGHLRLEYDREYGERKFVYVPIPDFES
jgi:hypothetical protein